MSYIPWGAAAAMAIIAGLLFWRLDDATEKLGAYQQENTQLKADIRAKDEALNSRARTDSEIRSLPPADILNRLR